MKDIVTRTNNQYISAGSLISGLIFNMFALLPLIEVMIASPRPAYIRPMAFFAAMSNLWQVAIIIGASLGLAGAYYAVKERNWSAGIMSFIGVILSVTPLLTVRLGLWLMEVILGTKLED